MPFVLASLGILFIVAGMRGTTSQLFTLLKGDFTGPNNFFFWALAILMVGSLGYIKKVQPFSDAFIALIIVVLFLTHKGFFDKFMQEVNATQTPSTSFAPTPNFGFIQ